MKKIIYICTVFIILSGCKPKQKLTQDIEVFDLMSQPSGKLYYDDQEILVPEAYQSFIVDDEAAITVVTINQDQSPNISIIRPKLSDDKAHLVFALSDNRTKENIEERFEAVVTYYLYDKRGGEGGQSIHQGFMVICKYVGDQENKQLIKDNGHSDKDVYYLKIVKVLPLG